MKREYDIIILEKQMQRLVGMVFLSTAAMLWLLP